MEKRIIKSKKNSKFEKSFLNVEDLDQLVREYNGEKTRDVRSHELEAMTIKLKDLKYFTKEDVEEIRRLNANDWRYRFYFSWLWDHLPKGIVVFFTMCLWIYWFGWFITIIAFLPITIAMFMILTFIRLSKGK